MMAMDSYHIDMAQRPTAESPAHGPVVGPLYALWRLPFVALGDPLRVYFANADALSVGVSLAIYAYLLSDRAARPARPRCSFSIPAERAARSR